ncbi:MAG: serine/threonine-protein kinase, partial [Gemmataceae bacterium]
GGTLADRLTQGPLDPREAAGLVRDVAGAVAAAHRAGVLHRDLKPDNVLLGAKGCAKVADFGLARLQDTDTSSLTVSGAVVGTPQYLSPEQAGGEAATAATDVWGLGAVLYACLSGRPPIEGASMLEALAAARGGKVAPVVGVPRGLAAVCLKCLAKRPVDRYATADVLADDLDRWLRGERPRAQRRRWRRWAAGLAVVALAGGLAAALLNKPAAQATDDRVLEVERSYKEGTPQVLLGATGKPAKLRQLTGRPVPPDAPLAADGSFAVEAVDSQCLFELLPDPGHDAYRLVAQIRHQRSDPIGMVGLYIGRTEHPRQPTPAHTFLCILLNDLRSLKDSPILIPGRLNRPAVNYVELLYKLLSDDQQVANVDASLYLQTGCSFSPAGPGREGWRELVVTVTPRTVIVQLGQSRYTVSRQVMQDTFDLKMTSTIRKQFVASAVHPTFHPRGGLGLYLSSGAACFRNVRLVPLMSSKSHE